MVSRGSKLVKNSLIFAIGTFAPKVLSFLLVPLYTSTMSTADFGAADLLFSTAALVYPVCTLQINVATMRYSFNRDDKLPLAVGYRYTVSGCFGAGLLLLVISLAFPEVLSTRNAFYLFTLISVNAMYALAVSYLRGTEQVGLIASVGALSSVLTVSLSYLFLAVFNAGIDGYITAQILALGLAFAVAFFMGDMKCNVFCVFGGSAVAQLAKDMCSFAIPLIFSGVAWWFNSSSSRYILAIMCGTSVSGIFAVAYKIPNILGSLQSVFSQAWLLSALEEDGKEGSEEYFHRSYMMYLTALVATTGLIYIFNIPLASMLFANDFFDAWRYVPMLTCCALITALNSFLESIFNARRETGVIAKTAIVGAMITVLLSMPLIGMLGAYGCGLATLVGYGAVLEMRMAHYRTTSDISLGGARSTITVLILSSASLLLPFGGRPAYFAILLTFLSVFLLRKEVGSAGRAMCGIVRKKLFGRVLR